MSFSCDEFDGAVDHVCRAFDYKRVTKLAAIPTRTQFTLPFLDLFNLHWIQALEPFPKESPEIMRQCKRLVVVVAAAFIHHLASPSTARYTGGRPSQSVRKERKRKTWRNTTEKGANEYRTLGQSVRIQCQLTLAKAWPVLSCLPFQGT